MNPEELLSKTFLLLIERISAAIFLKQEELMATVKVDDIALDNTR